MISLRDEIVRFCTMISKLRLGYGIFKYSATASQTQFHLRNAQISLPVRAISRTLACISLLLAMTTIRFRKIICLMFFELFGFIAAQTLLVDRRSSSL